MSGYEQTYGFVAWSQQGHRKHATVAMPQQSGLSFCRQIGESKAGSTTLFYNAGQLPHPQVRGREFVAFGPSVAALVLVTARVPRGPELEGS